MLLLVTLLILTTGVLDPKRWASRSGPRAMQQHHSLARLIFVPQNINIHAELVHHPKMLYVSCANVGGDFQVDMGDGLKYNHHPR